MSKETDFVGRTYHKFNVGDTIYCDKYQKGIFKITEVIFNVKSDKSSSSYLPTDLYVVVSYLVKRSGNEYILQESDILSLPEWEKRTKEEIERLRFDYPQQYIVKIWKR